MTAHPYPPHVRQAVAETLMGFILYEGPWHRLDELSQAVFLGDADKVLTALWEASRVAIDDIGELPKDTAFIDGDGFIASSVSHAESNWLENPVHIIYWG